MKNKELQDSNLKTLDPKIDLIFRTLFTKETECLRDLINKIVHFPKDKEFTQIEVLDPQLLPDNNDDKFSIMDIKATSRDGYQFNIEMQLSTKPDYIHRALFYWSRFHCEQLKKNEHYSKIVPTISIHILNFNLFPNSTKYHREYSILENQDHLPLTDHFQMHFLELTKVRENTKEDLVNWLLFLLNPQAPYMEGIMKENPIIEKANTKLRELSADESLRLIAEARFKADLDRNSDLFNARRDGLAEGKAEGKAEGLILGQKQTLKKILALKPSASANAPQELEARIDQENNLSTIELWIEKALRNESF